VEKLRKLKPLSPCSGLVVFLAPLKLEKVRRAKITLLALNLAGWVVLSPSVLAQQSKPQEYQIKAVYLYNFSKFVQWPQTTENKDTFAICVLGHDPFGAALDNVLVGEKIEQKAMVAQRITDVQEAAKCQILFIAISESSRAKQILSSLGKNSILTVSDIANFSLIGGMIQFVVQDNKVRFEVNLSAAEKAGLTFSSQLLKVASAVRKDSPAENTNP
jgi:YfiR/HmsC-like